MISRIQACFLCVTSLELNDECVFDDDPVISLPVNDIRRNRRLMKPLLWSASASLSDVNA